MIRLEEGVEPFIHSFSTSKQSPIVASVIKSMLMSNFYVTLIMLTSYITFSFILFE